MLANFKVFPWQVSSLLLTHETKNTKRKLKTNKINLKGRKDCVSIKRSSLGNQLAVKRV